MISNDTKSNTDTGRPGVLLGNLPRQFRPDDVADSRRAGFPVDLLFTPRSRDPKDGHGNCEIPADDVRLRSSEIARRQTELCKKVRAGLVCTLDRATYVDDEAQTTNAV